MSANNIAIKVENISKAYRIGMKDELEDSFAKTLFHFLSSPWRNYKKYRSLYKFDDLKGNRESGPTDVLWALKDVSFEVKRGEVLGIIGRNGAGKSTLLKVLSRITEPTSGYAEVHGRIVSLLEVGTGFHPELTGRENVYLNGTILGMRKKEVDRKFDEIVEFSGIERFIDTPVKRYSSGMTVRLAFSVAAHLEPEILLVDEVLAVGDARFQKKCLNKMEDVSKEGRTVLFVSHNMPAVTRLCQRAIAMGGGSLIDDGPSHKVVSTYLNSENGTMAEREWHDPATAPASSIARLHAVRVRNEDGQVVDAVDIHKAVRIDMEYEVLESGLLWLPHYHVFNEEGLMLFSAHDTDPTWLRRPRPAGRYRTTAWIPGNLLAEGTVFVNCGLATKDPAIPQFYTHDAVAFQVIDRIDENESARGGYAGPMSGVVRPLLNWTTEISPLEKRAVNS